MKPAFQRNIDQDIADRDWWEQLGKRMGLRLYGWTYRNNASFQDLDTGRHVMIDGWIGERLDRLLPRPPDEGINPET